MIPITLPPSAFPIILEAYHPETGKIVWSTTIERPNPGAIASIRVPALVLTLGHPVSVRARFADGTIKEQPWEEPPADG
jgi:hypothetical protein